MNQKVKLQINSNLPDVPRLCGTLLQETLFDAANLKEIVEQTSNHLKNLDLSSEQSLEKLKVSIETLDLIRVILVKIDSRIVDISGIINGLYQVLTKPQNEEQKEEENDSISSG